MALDFLNDAFVFSKADNNLYKLSKDGSVEQLTSTSGFKVSEAYNRNIIKTFASYKDQAKYIFTLTDTDDSPKGSGTVTATKQLAVLTRYESGNGKLKRMAMNYNPITMCMSSLDNYLYILTSHIQTTNATQTDTSVRRFPTPCVVKYDISSGNFQDIYDEFVIDASTSGLTVDDMIMDSNDVCYIISREFKRLYISTDNLQTFTLITKGIDSKPIKLVCDHSNNVYILCENKSIIRITNKQVNNVVATLPSTFSLNSSSSIVVLSTGKLYISGQTTGNKGCIAPILNNTVKDLIVLNNGYVTDMAVNKQDNVIVLTTVSKFHMLDTKTEQLSSAYTVGTGTGSLIGGIDMTACNTYNIYNVPIKSLANYPDGGWPIDTMDAEIQSILTQVRDGNISTRASKVEYNSIYPTVKDALDSILGVTPFVVKFVVNTGTGLYEQGSEITSLTIRWIFNRAVKHAYIRYIDASNKITEIADLANHVQLENGAIPLSSPATDVVLSLATPIKTSGKLYIYVTDGTTILGSTNYAVSSIDFVHRTLFGSISVSDYVALNRYTNNQWQALLDNLNQSILMSTPFNKFLKISCGTNETRKRIPILAVPSDWGVKPEYIIFANGFLSSWESSTTIYTNEAGLSISYDVFYLSYGLNGDLLLQIVDLMEVE